MLAKLSLDPLLDQEFEGRHRVERVQNSEVSYVRCLFGWIAKTFDYINRVKLTLPLLVYEGTWTHSPLLVAMHLLDRSCVRICFFEIACYVPQQKYAWVRWCVMCLNPECTTSMGHQLHYKSNTVPNPKSGFNTFDVGFPTSRRQGRGCRTTHALKLYLV